MLTNNANYGTGRIELLDLLRTWAVVVVLLTHFGVLDFKGIAVDLFFVLSGMLVSRPLIKAYYNKESFSFSDFFLKRFTKILPSYYFFILAGMVFAYFVVAPISPEQVPTLSELPQYFFFYRNYAGPPPRLTFEHVWSLCVEEQFYLLLPFAFYLAQKYFNFSPRKLIISLVIAGVCGVLIKIQALFTDIAEWPTYSHNRIDAFIWGILVGVFVYIKPDFSWSKISRFLLSAFSFVILALLIHIEFSWDPHELLIRIASPLCWSIIIICFMKQKIMYHHVFKKITLYTYNIYLWHFIFVIPVTYYFGSGLAGLFIYTTSTLITAIICTHLIERRVINYRPAIALQLKRLSYVKQTSKPIEVEA